MMEGGRDGEGHGGKEGGRAGPKVEDDEGG